MPGMDAGFARPDFKRDPYPVYRRLRNETPVVSVRLPDGRTAWLVTRYADVAAVLKDERFAKDPSRAVPGKPPWTPAFFRPLTRNMLDLDAPDHTRLRGLVHKAFTPRLVEQMGERIRRLTESLLDPVAGRGRMDLIRDYALPIPSTIIAEILGVPQEDQRRFQRWSNAIVAASPSGWGMLRAIPGVLKFMRYIRRLVRRRRQVPGDDLVSALVRGEESGEMLNEDELLAMIFLLLIAGFETTVNLIGNGTLALLEHPGQMRRLRADPSLLPGAVEELLRFDGPLEMATERYAIEDVAIGDVTIPRGALVHAVLASANRDERQFPDPDSLDLTREPNRHLAFGLGVHYCLGAPLARLEGQIAFDALLRRFPDMRLSVPRAQLRWRRGLVLRGLEALPLEFGATTAARIG